MIDLDVRLDSSLWELDYGYLSRLQGLEKHEPVVLSYPQNKRKDYYAERDHVLELLQTKEAINYAINSLLSRFEREGYVYIEIAFNPYMHTKGGLTVEQVCKIAVDSLQEALDKYYIYANMIFYAQKEAPLEITNQVASLAYKYRKENVIAFGLEGDTNEVPLSRFSKIFNRLKKNNFPVVLELCKKQYVKSDIEHILKFGIKRIISCYKVDFDQNDIYRFVEEKIFFEYRPHHDLVNQYYSKKEEFALKSLWIKGFTGYVAGCSYTICNGSLKNEYNYMCDNYAMRREDIQNSMQISLDAIFVPVKEKAKIVQQYAKRFSDYFAKFGILY